MAVLLFFSLAELNPDFTNQVINLDETKGWKLLDDGVGTFRLVVPNEISQPALL
jgi:hypothetical protein